MSEQTVALLKSWAGTFAAAVVTAFLAVFGDGEVSVDDLKYVGVAGVTALLVVIKNWFDTDYKNYGKIE